MIRMILLMLATLLSLTSCRSRKVERKEEQRKEVQQLELKKDSIFSELKRFEKNILTFENTQSFELELESDIDSMGNSKQVIVERIRSPTGDKIIVIGAKARLKITKNKQNVVNNNETIIENKTSVQTQENKRQIKEYKSFEKQKEVQAKGFSFGIYLLLILILIALFLAWRFKLFRYLKPIVTLFKRLLKSD